MVNQLLIKLKTILHCKYTYVLLLILVSIITVFKIISDRKISYYSVDDNSFILVVDAFQFDGNKLTLELRGKEDLVGSYYIDTESQLQYLKDNIKYGVSLKIIGELKVPKENTVPKAFNYKNYLNNKDIFYTLSINKLEILDNKINYIYKFKNIINERILNIDDTGYMKAFILGDSGLIDDEVYKSYQGIGVTHLFALSGTQVCLISIVVFKVLKRTKEWKRYLIVNVLVILYAMIVGFPASIKRCVVFFIINSINKVFKFELSNLKILFLTVLFLVIYDYKIIYDVGFLYSAITVAGIILCQDYINCDNKLLSSFRLSLVSFLFSMPISLFTFYEVNILSIFYNIIYVPVVGGFVYFLCLGSFVCPIFYRMFYVVVNVLEDVSLFLDSINLFNIWMDFNIVEIILFYVFLGLIFVIQKNIFIVGLFIIVLFDYVCPYFDSSAYVYFFDVGQGDCSLIIGPYRREVILVDTGGITNYAFEEWMKKDDYHVFSNVLSFLKSMGIKKIDYLLLTHGDYDHMGDASYVVDNVEVKNVLFNNDSYNNLELELIHKLKSKGISYGNKVNRLDLSNRYFFINDGSYDNENDNSLVLYTEIYDKKLLFMGDVGIEVEVDLINKYDLNNIDVLKVGHHGSKTSSGDEFIDWIKPKNSVISVGESNRFGHPNNEVLSNLIDSNIYRTDKQGSIIFKITKNDLIIMSNYL